jgi:hypothetical protein
MKQQSAKSDDGAEKKGWWNEHEVAKDTEEEEAHPVHPDIESVFAELENKRMQSGLSPGTDDDFPVSISSEAWTISQKGLAYTAFRAMAKAGQPTEWCRKYGLHQTCSLEVALYGDEVAALMSRAWSHRVQFLLNMWRASNDPGFVYDEGCLSEYVEPSDFALLAWTAKGKLGTRIAQIRKLRPRHPVC